MYGEKGDYEAKGFLIRREVQFIVVASPKGAYEKWTKYMAISQRFSFFKHSTDVSVGYSESFNARISLQVTQGVDLVFQPHCIKSEPLRAWGATIS